MDDLIIRQAAIDALRYAQHRFTVADEAGGMGTVKWSEDVIYFAAAKRVLDELPSAQPAIVPCNYVEACNVATMDKPISAYTYLSVLEDLKDHGFVLVDMREVTT